MRILAVIIFILLCLVMARIYDLITLVNNFIEIAFGTLGAPPMIKFSVFAIVVGVIAAGLTASGIYIALAIAKAIREVREAEGGVA